MSKNSFRYALAAMATAISAQGAFAQEAEDHVSGTIRVHASTLADGDIKFTELPELSADFRLNENFSLGTSLNLITPPGENLLTDTGSADARIDDIFLRYRNGDITVNVGQLEFMMDRSYGEIWTAAGVGYIAPQIIDEPSFAQHAIARTMGAQVEYRRDLGEGNSLYTTAAAGKQGGGDDLQYMGMVRLTHSFDSGASVSGSIQRHSRDVGGAVNEEGTFVMGQASLPINDHFGVRGDIELGVISNVGGVRGQDGTLTGVRAFLDWKPSDNFGGYLGLGAFREAAGGSFQAIEGGVAYRLRDNITVHGGVGYANDGWARGTSTMAGLSIGF